MRGRIAAGDILEAVENVSVRVPSARALTLLGDALVLLPNDSDKRHARLHQPPRHEQARAVDRIAAALAD